MTTFLPKVCRQKRWETSELCSYRKGMRPSPSPVLLFETRCGAAISDHRDGEQETRRRLGSLKAYPQALI